MDDNTKRPDINETGNSGKVQIGKMKSDNRENRSVNNESGSYNIKLPTVSDDGYFEIKLESIGGLGANLCGKMLGELGALILNLNSASFSSYGSEKSGSFVQAYIRWSKENVDIGINSPIENPHILGVFHDAIIGKNDVTSGVTKKTKIIVNTTDTPEKVRDRMKLFAGEVFCIDAQKIAMETKSRINMVMLGSIAKASGFIPLDAVIEIAKETIGKKYPDLMERNIEAINRGYAEITSQMFEEDGKYEKKDSTIIKSKWGYDDAPIGGVNPIFGSTVTNDLSASRAGYIPIFLQEKCINCGLCDSTCPDMVFQFVKKEINGKKAMVNTGLDYHHCKGCLRCVEVCPVGALVKGLESENPNPKHYVRNKDLIVGKLDYEEVGANPEITSESFLQEKRVDGGLV